MSHAVPRARLMPFVLLACLGASSLAQASTPNAVYVVPSRVDFLPDANTATSVIIHGAFFFWMRGGAYSAPACGFMSFACPQGKEATCRMEWNDIVTTGKNGSCAGFGQQNMMTGATFYKEGQMPGKPDVWDVGLGIAPGGFVGGQCQPAQMLKCPLGGVPDLAMSGPPDMASVPPDLSTTPPDLAKAPPPADLAVTPPPPDLAKAPQVSPPSNSCTVGGHAASPTSMALLVLLVGLALGRRARR